MLARRGRRGHPADPVGARLYQFFAYTKLGAEPPASYTQMIASFQLEAAAN